GGKRTPPRRFDAGCSGLRDSRRPADGLDLTGIYVWRDPHGATYLVDHTGTRQLRGPAGHRQAPPPKPLVAELHHSPARLEYDAA
ncbi:MAG: hypothetical protein ACRDOM_10865, partial [Nocardioides sp.]